MYTVYGGKRLRQWLGGEKCLLKEMGIFRTDRNVVGHRIKPTGRQAIRRVLARNRARLFP
jgi:hypothetical protein